MKSMFTLAAGAALTCALACGGNSASPTAPGQPEPSEFSGPNAIVSLKIEAPATLTVGDTVQIKVLATLVGGASIDVTGKALLSVSNAAVATVSASGELRAIAPGDCGLTALLGAISTNLNTHIRARVGNIVRLDIRGKVDLDLGEKTQLLAIATLDTGGELDVTAKASFSSSNEAVLRVSASGLLEAVGAGTCDLLSIVDGIRASVKINVRGRGDSDPITRLDIRGKVALDLGERAQLRVVATLNTGAEEDVTARAVLKSQNDAVLRVTAGGVIEAVGIGASVLLATVDASHVSIPAEVTLGTIVTLDIDGPAELTVGDRLNVKVMGTNTHGSRADVTSKTDLSSANSAILRVNAGGLIEALGPGSCDLIAVHGGVRGLVRLNVKARADVLVKLRIEGANVLKVGQTTALKVFAGMSDNTEVDVTARVAWKTDNGACGLSLGLVTGHGPGSCLISVSLDGISASLNLNVTAAAATIVALRIEGLTLLRIGQTAQLKAIATMSDNTEVDVTGRVSWSCNNLLSLVVNASGLLSALLPGDCLVTGVVDGIKATASVKVTL